MTPGPRAARRRLPAALLALALLLALMAAGAAAFVLDRVNVAPRQLGPYIERRADGHNAAIESVGHWLGSGLVALDRDSGPLLTEAALRLGAQDAPASGRVAREVEVASVGALYAAVGQAQPGDAITLQPGSYRIGATLAAFQPGSEAAPITLRARRPGSVTLLVETVEAIRIGAPWWRIENLEMRGVCGDDSSCEHALHIVGAAHHVAIVNNTLVDFNAHIKINGENGRFPDHGLIESNTLHNTKARMTTNPVTPIDLVAASDWNIRRNLISDFVKGFGDGISYGAFAKGAGERNLFEQNLVWCERRLRGLGGKRVGLSLGGGATGKPYCRDRACVVEQQDASLQSNLIASCSDVGIYLNNAAGSRLVHNSVIDTAGVDVRFAGSSADLEGNLVDGVIRSRDGGVVRERDNRSTPPLYAYLGYSPVRALFAGREFAWRDEVPRREGATSGAPHDLCGRARSAAPAYGAFDDFAPCLASAASAAGPQR
ncbi:right-handed parallel beta-helix repeat-containing protein [Massilia sp. IC2-477]|uniref:right-handed parallel beta-helix repeat-containing protein n=1 Tax=Massilia sp. IC2-477 TaxID=2887198 RepID=UPI001D118693|nr:right-handed parallel beta-helix repeat-containing protein [Massilia sp. IC2-477]MCC2955039.1 right-handed parallel beta-helix repeat-containing protein [Massilia sp. IC2-477]